MAGCSTKLPSSGTAAATPEGSSLTWGVDELAPATPTIDASADADDDDALFTAMERRFTKLPAPQPEDDDSFLDALFAKSVAKAEGAPLESPEARAKWEENLAAQAKEAAADAASRKHKSYRASVEADRAAGEAETAERVARLTTSDVGADGEIDEVLRPCHTCRILASCPLPHRPPRGL